MATNLYAALVTDTGDFRYSNATPRAFAAAARLVAAGAKPARDRRGALGAQPGPGRAPDRRGARHARAAGRRAAGGHHLRPRDAGARRAPIPEDTENLVNIPRAIDGVRVAVFLKAVPSTGAVRVSLRSRADVDVQSVARTFGGGGHRNAAGCTIQGSLAEARRALLAAALLPVVESS